MIRTSAAESRTETDWSDVTQVWSNAVLHRSRCNYWQVRRQYNYKQRIKSSKQYIMIPDLNRKVRMAATKYEYKIIIEWTIVWWPLQSLPVRRQYEYKGRIKWSIASRPLQSLQVTNLYEYKSITEWSILSRTLQSLTVTTAVQIQMIDWIDYCITAATIADSDEGFTNTKVLPKQVNSIVVTTIAGSSALAEALWWFRNFNSKLYYLPLFGCAWSTTARHWYHSHVYYFRNGLHLPQDLLVAQVLFSNTIILFCFGEVIVVKVFVARQL